MSLANWSPRRHFYCGCSTGAGGIWWVGHPRGALDTQQGKNLQWHWEWAEGREEDLVHRSRAGFRGENTLIGQCRKGGVRRAGQLVISPSFLYLEVRRMSRILFSSPAHPVPMGDEEL